MNADCHEILLQPLSSVVYLLVMQLGVDSPCVTYGSGVWSPNIERSLYIEHYNAGFTAL
jgi:hypothetical protein